MVGCRVSGLYGLGVRVYLGSVVLGFRPEGLGFLALGWFRVLASRAVAIDQEKLKVVAKASTGLVVSVLVRQRILNPEP